MEIKNIKIISFAVLLMLILYMMGTSFAQNICIPAFRPDHNIELVSDTIALKDSLFVFKRPKNTLTGYMSEHAFLAIAQQLKESSEPYEIRIVFTYQCGYPVFSKFDSSHKLNSINDFDIYENSDGDGTPVKLRILSNNDSTLALYVSYKPDFESIADSILQSAYIVNSQQRAFPGNLWLYNRKRFDNGLNIRQFVRGFDNE